MAPYAPYGPGRRVVAGVSGGADSTALALLLRAWGSPLAVVVDHGLRPEAAAEASQTGACLAGLGISTRIVRLAMRPGPAAAARARAARYAALLDVCRTEGLPDLLVAHHAQDQAETQTLRARAGSGPAGLAGMAAVSWRGDARLLRPLLAIAPQRLRATCQAAGVGWVEDPGNLNPATPRGALRLGLDAMPLLDPAHGSRRTAKDKALADELATVALHPGGYAQVGTLSPAAWSALVWTLSGRAYPPPAAGAARLAAAGQGTLHGVQVRAGWAFREPAATAFPVPARAGARWDARFTLSHAVPGGELGALGPDAGVVHHRPGPPLRALQALPVLRIGGKLFAAPHMAYPDAATCRSVPILFRPAQPLAGAAFAPPGQAGRLG